MSNFVASTMDLNAEIVRPIHYSYQIWQEDSPEPVNSQ